MSAWLVAWARAHAPATAGGVLVVVDRAGAITAHVLPTLAAACQYADDVVSELDPPDTTAVVLDARHAVVHRGTHYAARGGR
jgi:hypothetical protein